MESAWRRVLRADSPDEIILMRKGCRPVWESKKHKNGASLNTIVERFANGETRVSREGLKKYFTSLCMLVSGKLGNDITGMQLSVKGWGVRATAWSSFNYTGRTGGRRKNQMVRRMKSLFNTNDMVKVVRHCDLLAKASQTRPSSALARQTEVMKDGTIAKTIFSRSSEESGSSGEEEARDAPSSEESEELIPVLTLIEAPVCLNVTPRKQLIEKRVSKPLPVVCEPALAIATPVAGEPVLADETRQEVSEADLYTTSRFYSLAGTSAMAFAVTGYLLASACEILF